MYGHDPWTAPGTEDTLAGYYAVSTPVSPEDYPSGVRPDGPPEHVPSALVCDDETFSRLNQQFDEADLEWGTTHDDGQPTLAARVDGTRFEHGDVATITLLNVRRRRTEVEYEHVGDRAKYNLQVRTEAGWQEARGSPTETYVYTDEGVCFAHGRGYVWRLGLDRDSVVDRETDDRFPACPAVPPGRYRFVYWASDPPLAVAFDLVEPVE